MDHVKSNGRNYPSATGAMSSPFVDTGAKCAVLWQADMMDTRPAAQPPCRHVWPWTRRPAQRLLLPDWLAITLGGHIISWRELDAVELAHEAAHVEQWRRYGVRFIPRYLLAGRRASRAGGDRYRDNEFESAARAEAELVRTASGH